ncbi:MAG TPA: putative sugar nucleotidyl transferase [Chitinophagaceae bacterium]|nr:putative sugar nucleotidyl transferase [Chitinophagaceae bacterium]
MDIVLFDNKSRRGLLPLTFTCAIADLRIGIFTVKERWGMLSGKNVFVHTETYLQPLYENIPAGEHLWIDASILADARLVDEILSLNNGTAVAEGNNLIAGVITISQAGFDASDCLKFFANIRQVQNVRRLQQPWEIFQWNDAMIREDFTLIRSKKTSIPLSATNTYLNSHDIFIEEGAEVNFAVLNASAGPIYIGRNAVIMEGSLIRGPFAACEGAVIKMGTKIYAATTIGPHCLAGGEIKNAVMQAYSNKGHDGYLGDSVIGKWCNLGAGTSNSNVKNTGSSVQMWNFGDSAYHKVGLKGGLIMGDYSRCAINTSFNTGTVTGICCNIFENGLLPKYIPSFSWGGKNNGKYKRERVLTDIENWKRMKGQPLTIAEKEVLQYVFEEGL